MLTLLTLVEVDLNDTTLGQLPEGKTVDLDELVFAYDPQEGAGFVAHVREITPFRNRRNRTILTLEPLK